MLILDASKSRITQAILIMRGLEFLAHLQEIMSLCNLQLCNSLLYTLLRKYKEKKSHLDFTMVSMTLKQMINIFQLPLRIIMELLDLQSFHQRQAKVTNYTSYRMLSRFNLLRVTGMTHQTSIDSGLSLTQNGPKRGG